MSKVVVMDHPLIEQKIGIIRRKETGTKDFRQNISEIAMLIGYEATKDLPLEEVEIETPICKTTVKQLKGKKLALVPILRAGLGMVDGMLSLIPAAKVGHIGLYRNPETLKPVEYYCKLPADCAEREVFVVDPMLATGGSSIAAIQLLKDKGCKSIRLLCIIAAPEGVKAMQAVSYTMPLDAIDAVDYVTFQNYGPRKSSLVWSAYSSFYTTAVNYGYPAEKIRLSMATTAVMSDNSGKNVKGYKDLDFSTVTAESNTGTIGGVDYTFNGVKEVQKKMQLLVDNNTGGCMYFDMGNDVSVQDELSLIRALSMTIHSNVDTLVTKVSTDPVGIEEKKLYPELNSAKVSVYPNPSDGNFQVDLPFSGEAVCDLFSMTGNKVYSTIGEKQIRFSLSGILSTGLYILKIDSSEGQATTKVQIK